MNNIQGLSKSQNFHLMTDHFVVQSKTRIQQSQTQHLTGQREKYPHFTLSQNFSHSKKHSKQLFNQSYRNYNAFQMNANSLSNENIYLLMKQQIDIAVAKYEQKIEKVLIAQAQQIQKLSSLIAYHNQVIQKQAQIIRGYKKNEQMPLDSNSSIAQFNDSQKTLSKSPAKISLTKRRSTNQKISIKQSHFSPLKVQNRESQEIEKKMSKLQYQLEEIDYILKLKSNQSQQLLYKVNFAQQSITKAVWTKLRNYQKLLTMFLTTILYKVKQMQKTITLFDSKMNKKDYGKQKNKNKQISDSDIQESQILSSLQLYVPRHLLNHQNEGIEERSIELNLLHQSNTESSQENQFEVSQQQIRLGKLLQFQNTLSRRGTKLPVRVYIDQNGQIKDFWTEAAIVDDSFNPFQSTANQIKHLRMKKVIY